MQDRINIEKYKAHYSEQRLGEKLSKMARKAGLKVVYAVLLLYYALQSPAVSARDKGIIYGALGYFILPFDFVHDYIPFAGFADDFAALAWAISKVVRNITPQVKAMARDRVTSWFPTSAKETALFESVENGK